MKEEALRALGLSDKEIKIYLANLQLGTSLVQDIAKYANLNRTSTYDILSSLEKQGYVSYVIKSGKRYYQATHPDKLIELIKEKEILVKKALPELRAIKETIIKKPTVEVYTGKEGLKSIFEDILRANKDFVCIASKIHLSKLFQFYFPYFVERRIKQGIKVKLISDDIPYDKKANYKIIKKQFKTAIWVYSDKIAMISLEEKEPIGIIIQEKNFVDTYRLIFDMLWENL
jgi:sugar-specific transcriptional regulator TrmB